MKEKEKDRRFIHDKMYDKDIRMTHTADINIKNKYC